jgi:hypothetical protein
MRKEPGAETRYPKRQKKKEEQALDNLSFVPPQVSLP